MHIHLFVTHFLLLFECVYTSRCASEMFNKLLCCQPEGMFLWFHSRNTAAGIALRRKMHIYFMSIDAFRWSSMDAFNRTTFIASSCHESFEISSKENMYQIASELLGNLNIRNSLSRLFIISLYYHQKLSIFSQFVSFIDIVTSNSHPQPNLHTPNDPMQIHQKFKAL